MKFALVAAVIILLVLSAVEMNIVDERNHGFNVPHVWQRLREPRPAPTPVEVRRDDPDVYRPDMCDNDALSKVVCPKNCLCVINGCNFNGRAKMTAWCN